MPNKRQKKNSHEGFEPGTWRLLQRAHIHCTNADLLETYRNSIWSVKGNENSRKLCNVPETCLIYIFFINWTPMIPRDASLSGSYKSDCCLLLTSNMFFYELKVFLLIKTGCSVIDFSVIFPMKTSEFTKSLNFESISKNQCTFFFHLNIDFYRLKNIFLIWKRVYSH